MGFFSKKKKLSQDDLISLKEKRIKLEEEALLKRQIAQEKQKIRSAKSDKVKSNEAVKATKETVSKIFDVGQRVGKNIYGKKSVTKDVNPFKKKTIKDLKLF